MCWEAECGACLFWWEHEGVCLGLQTEELVLASIQLPSAVAGEGRALLVGDSSPRKMGVCATWDEWLPGGASLSPRAVNGAQPKSLD